VRYLYYNYLVVNSKIFCHFYSTAQWLWLDSNC
jgi:hypothetical protein